MKVVMACAFALGLLFDVGYFDSLYYHCSQKPYP